jgi:uncharacterized membrane protein
MHHLIRAGRTFFAVGLIGIGLQHFQFGEFRPVILPEWPAGWQSFAPGAYITGLMLIIAGFIILLYKYAEKTCLLLAGFFFIFFLVFHFTFLVFFNPNSFHLGSWTNALKELAFSGGSLVMSGSFVNDKKAEFNKPIFSMLEKTIPAGVIFFSIMMIVFGIDHFIYTDFVASLVPSWIPGHVFWTYFAGIALIGSGVGMILKKTRSTVALLTGIMVLLWLILLHIPRAVADPHMDKGNEVTSVFEALAYGGVALVIAGLNPKKL